MRILFIEDGRFGKVMRRLALFIEYWWMKFFVIPAVSTIPPTLIIFYLETNDSGASDGTKDAAENEQVVFSILELISSHPYWTVLVAAAYLMVWNAVIGYIHMYSQNKEEIDSRGLLTLFEVLETVVGAKARRFGSCAKEFLSVQKEQEAGHIFETITKPDQQIALLAKAIHAFFDSIDKAGVSFRVSIIAAENGVPSDYYYYYPESESPVTPIEVLQSEESSVSYCIRKKKILVVPDLQVEANKDDDRHYVPSQEEMHEEGSLICYPVIHHYSDSVPYAITVVADKKGYFSHEKKKFYNWVFRHFAVRMGLEHSLIVLKERSDHL